MTLNRDIFQRDPAAFTIPNDGVTVIGEPRTSEEWAVLRYELESFVCEGEYAAGMQRVLSTFLGHLDEPRQPAVWVSGFYGSGKSHFVRMLQYLWQDITLPDGAQARSLRALPSGVADLFRELTTAGRREGGLWAAAGTLGAGEGSIRRAILSILFQAAGLPSQLAPARFMMWLMKKGLYETVVAEVETQGSSLAAELPDMYVSPILARGVLKAQPELGATPKDLLASLRSQFGPKDEIDNDEMVQIMAEVLALRSSRPGKWPLTLLVLDELQQSIGNDADRTLQVQNIVQACTARFKSNLLVVATGQSALEDSPQLSKLKDRFTVPVTLSDQDVHKVLREVVLRKRPEREAELRDVLEGASGEINRHLQGTRIAPTAADEAALVPDYPLLPTRRRFWERLLRGIDVSGTAAQLRTQLRVVWGATRAVAGAPLGTVVPVDIIYEQQRPSMEARGLLLPELSSTIAALDDGTPDGHLRSRVCATLFLIQQLPTAGVLASGVRGTADALADLLVENLPAGSAALRGRLPGILQGLVEAGTLMVVEGEYRLQTRESAEWERDRRARYQRIRADEPRLASDRATEFRATVSEALKGIKLLHGQAKTPRDYDLHWGLEAPAGGSGHIPVWVRDGWSVLERNVHQDAQAAGADSAVVFVLLPRQNADELSDAIASHAAAAAVLDARAATQLSPEGIEARGSMQTRKEAARGNLSALLAGIVANARVFQGGGNEVAEGSLKDSLYKALEASMARLFPQYVMADDERWGTVVKLAGQGDAGALRALGYLGATEQHPVCREVLGYLTPAGKAGLDVRRHFMGAGYGWSQDAVDGALLTLLAAGLVEAFDKGRNARTPKEIPQSGIGVVTFSAATVVISAIQRIAVRGLITGLGLPVQAGEEAAAIPRVLQKLVDLAKDAGGAPPLPESPANAWLDDLLARHGNEQFMAVYDARARLSAAHSDWQRAKDLAAARLPRWEVLKRLLDRAEGLPVAAMVRPQMEAILANRSLLADPDPVQPLVTELSKALRAALQTAWQALVAVRDRELAALQGDPAWERLSDAQWLCIFEAQNVGPVPALILGSEQALLQTLDEKPLRTWEDWALAVPARMQRAREEAARLLEPECVRVHPQAATLRTAAEVTAYLDTLKTEIMAHIAAGKPVIL